MSTAQQQPYAELAGQLADAFGTEPGDARVVGAYTVGFTGPPAHYYAVVGGAALTVTPFRGHGWVAEPSAVDGDGVFRPASRYADPVGHTDGPDEAWQKVADAAREHGAATDVDADEAAGRLAAAGYPLGPAAAGPASGEPDGPA